MTASQCTQSFFPTCIKLYKKCKFFLWISDAQPLFKERNYLKSNGNWTLKEAMMRSFVCKVKFMNWNSYFLYLFESKWLFLSSHRKKMWLAFSSHLIYQIYQSFSQLIKWSAIPHSKIGWIYLQICQSNTRI